MATVTEAEGLAELGLWQDAWDALEALPAEDRSTPAVSRVRLACCPPLDAWELGKQLADLLREGDKDDRRSATTFYHLRRQGGDEGRIQGMAAATAHDA